MFTKKLFLVFVITAFTVTTAFSEIYTVDNNAANNPDFTQLQAAHDAAADGDIIYVSGSVTSYYNTELSKKLYIYGPGYFLDQNSETQAKLLTAQLQWVVFQPGSEGSLLTGFEIVGISVDIRASNITLKRNRITSWGGLKLWTINSVICQNYIQCPIWVYEPTSNVIIRNNFIDGPLQLGSSANPPIPLDIQNNVIRGDVTINTCVFYNNILLEGNFNAANCDVRNNIGNSTQFGTSNGNQENVDMNTVFIGTASSDGKWQLAPGSPAIGAGIFGEDCGMFGGNDPYVLSGLPAIPAIYLFVAPASVSGLQGLPVQVKVKSHN